MCPPLSLSERDSAVCPDPDQYRPPLQGAMNELKFLHYVEAGHINENEINEGSQSV